MARFVPARFLLAAAVLAGALSVATEIAQAQRMNDDRYFMSRDPFRRNVPFFNFPFGRDAQPKPSYVEPPSDQPVGAVYGSAAAADEDRLLPATEYVLVFGDTLAEQLAQGLADAFVTDRPEVTIIKKTRSSTGFVRADVYDWPARIPSLLATEKVTAIALMLGANDRQSLRDETGTHEPRSERWREIYGKRVEDTLNRLKEKGVPIFIVGLPAMRNQRLSDDMEYINDILSERAEKTGTYYVDVWDGFVDEEGEFMSTGPALDGQKRRLRISDGVHFTKAGGRKLAHYVERDLVRLFDLRAGRPQQLPQQGPEVAPSGRPVAGPVLPLTQPAGPVGPLAGAGPRTATPADAVAARVLVEGLPVEPVSGRADDFRWPQTGASAAFAQPDATEAAKQTTPVQPADKPASVEPSKGKAPAQKSKQGASAQPPKPPAAVQPGQPRASAQPTDRTAPAEIIRVR